MEQLGIEPIQLLTQVINFVIMVLLLSKFLYKPIMKGLDERRKKIEEGLAYTEKMKEEMEKIDKKKREATDQAKEEAKNIIDDGKKTGKSLEQEIIEKAHKEAEQIVEKGREELMSERVLMEKQLKAQTIDIAQSMARKILEDALNPEDQKAIIDKKIAEISKLVK